ncbi:F-box synaptic protein isoform X2 [Colletes latitarsis]|uniref:F-box synaptic protein isoform X2 n=1 Tax=Colletes latitarsis TaxID=2605962 RepID=UPI0040355609
MSLIDTVQCVCVFVCVCVYVLLVYWVRTGKMGDIALRASDLVLEVIFSYLDLNTLRNCSMVCKRWNKFLNYENNGAWRMHCIRKLAQEALSSDLLSSVPTYKSKLRAFYHAWNPRDRSRNIYIKPNGFTLHRNPVAQSTDACRGKIGFRHGRHAWEVIWEGPLGTVAVIGIATKEAPLLCHGYVALLGSNEHSWGWNLVDNHLLHNGDVQGNYPLLNNAPKYQGCQTKDYIHPYPLYMETQRYLWCT